MLPSLLYSFLFFLVLIWLLAGCCWRYIHNNNSTPTCIYISIQTHSSVLLKRVVYVDVFLGAVTINILYILYGWLFWFVLFFFFFFCLRRRKGTRMKISNDSQTTDGIIRSGGDLFGRDRSLRDRPKHHTTQRAILNLLHGSYKYQEWK